MIASVARERWLRLLRRCLARYLGDNDIKACDQAAAIALLVGMDSDEFSELARDHLSQAPSRSHRYRKHLEHRIEKLVADRRQTPEDNFTTYISPGLFPAFPTAVSGLVLAWSDASWRRLGRDSVAGAGGWVWDPFDGRVISFSEAVDSANSFYGELEAFERLAATLVEMMPPEAVLFTDLRSLPRMLADGRNVDPRVERIRDLVLALPQAHIIPITRKFNRHADALARQAMRDQVVTCQAQA